MFRKVVYYQTSNGRLPVSEWLATLGHLIRTRIRARIDRLAGGNAGDYRPVGDGVLEMRLHFGPGYRVYYSYDGFEVVLLLLGGDKSTQVNDIGKAKIFWKDYQRRKQ